MPTRELTTFQELEDLATGANFMSASGGGPTTEALAFMRENVEAGHPHRLTDLAALPDDATVAAAFFTGSVAPTRYARKDQEAAFDVKTTVAHPPLEAVRELEKRAGVTIDAIIPIELGGNNTGHAVATAAALGKLAVDADFSGRAIPEALCTAPHLAGMSMAPFACATYYGDRVFVAQTQNNAMSERLGKHVAMSAFGSAGCAGFLMDGAAARRVAIAGTLSRCIEIGRAIRDAGSSGDPVAQIAARFADIRLLFRGRLAERTWENRDGYMWGEHIVAGSGAFAGHSLRMWFKNENHVSWLDGEPYVCSPDVIEVVDAGTAAPLVNSFLEEGMDIAAMGVRRSAPFDTQAGIALMCPRRWGFDFDYRRMEDVLSANDAGD